ncbi:MAG: RnfABCDGE type electron transport complex subunit D [Candidatus Margulisbacteria bacterium]|jgi:electron transport complex protein RnfD|nr:RnfABCDGE type electron transport complex subunit D [Candidatus Margulisiibacteriota bacterium]
MSFDISVGPHIRAPYDSKKIMWLVALTLLLPAGAGVYFFGFKALQLIIFTTLAAVATEAVCQWFAKRPITVSDGSAAVTGLLLALIVPPTLPLWMAGIGAAFAIAIVKVLFGGLGFNIFNPALAARAFLLASWPVAMTSWVRPFDAVTTATPLYLVNKLHQTAPSYWDLLIGNRAGSLGETSALAIMIGAGLLLLVGVIDWAAPAAMIGSVAFLSWLLGYDPLFAVLSGGLMLGAFYMATDYVTAPVTVKGRVYFGLGCGLIIILIRYFGGFPEGVNYSILIMNMLTPVIDKYARPRLYGAKR